MPKVSVELIVRVGALLIFVFAAAVVVTSRRGRQLIVIGVVFSRLPFVSEVASRRVAG